MDELPGIRGISDGHFLNEKKKEAERKSDRRFLWTVTLVSAIIGAITGSVITIIFECFFK